MKICEKYEIALQQKQLLLETEYLNKYIYSKTMAKIVMKII